jgi:hypothetical protein
MRPGDDVVFLPDVLGAGIGEILEVRRDGQVLVRFDQEDDPRPCDPHDVELLELFQEPQHL